MRTRMPQPIPYQGSKRNIAPRIIELFPDDIVTLHELFAGSAALSIRTAFEGKAGRFHLNDVNAPLMALLRAIINKPDTIARDYDQLWHQQQEDPRLFYDEVRAEFNRTHQAAHFLYLLARCVKASVRYNSSGEFNQGPDNRRLGRRPESMRREIFRVSELLKDRTEISSFDYQAATKVVNPKTDLVYMDPPYQGTSNGRDGRYVRGLGVEEFAAFLHTLNENDVMYIVSYDGRKGDKVYGRSLPISLELKHLEINAGPSTQSTLLGKRDLTFESLYLSPALVKLLSRDKKNFDNDDPLEIGYQSNAFKQLEFGFT